MIFLDKLDMLKDTFETFYNENFQSERNYRKGLCDGVLQSFFNQMHIVEMCRNKCRKLIISFLVYAIMKSHILVVKQIKQ